MIRDLVKAVGGVAATYGYASGGMVEMIAGALAFLGASIWSWHTNKTTSMVNAVAASDTVNKVVMATPADAKATPALAAERKVTGPSG